MDLKKTSTLISKYELEIENGSDLTEQLNNNKQIFRDILHLFPEADNWLASDDLMHKEIVKKVKNIIKSDNIAPKVCNSDGFVGISKLVSYVFKTNDFFEIIFGQKIKAEVYYDLMCSVTHNNFYNILKLFIVPNTAQFKVSLYPQPDEKHNKISIIKMLYASFVDLLACFDEINICIQNTNKMPYCKFSLQKNMSSRISIG